MEKEIKPIIENTKINDLTIFGYKTDYVFNTIKNSKEFYEISILSKWLPFLKESEYIMDIGANIGNHTLYWAKNLKYKKIFSFEPCLLNYEILDINIRNNNLKKVKEYNCAIGDKNGFVKIKKFNISNYGATEFEYTEDREESVPIRTVDEIMKTEKIPRVDFVKIDTEGFEIRVLKGMDDTLRRFSPIIWAETSTNNVENLYDLLSLYGYKIIDICDANVLLKKTDDNEYSFKKLLVNYFYKTEKANTYYSNYEKAKQWVENYKNKLEKEKQKNDEFKKTVDFTKLENYSEILSKLNECLEENKNALKLLDESKEEIRKLYVKNNYLKSENIKYAGIASLINTWYGKIAYKIYNFLSTIISKIKKFINKLRGK